MAYKLKYKGEEIDDLLEQVDEKTIYENATPIERGLMSSKDKKKLDDVKDAESISNLEILNLFRYGF